MKEIKIFLASSNEIEFDRIAFGNFVRRLDNLYEKRGKRIRLFEWEDLDSAYNNCRKQDEYNEKVRQSDMFLALFYRKAGKYTKEEFEVATEAFRDYASPKVYVFCKDIQENEKETPELLAFKEYLSKDLKYFWCQYNNRESLQLQFVMQLLLLENNKLSELGIKDGIVFLDDIEIARIEKLKYIQKNDYYQIMNKKLSIIREELEKIRLLSDEHQDNQEYRSMYLSTQKRYVLLQQELRQHQDLILDAVKRFAKYQGQKVSERMKRAIKAFEDGKVHEANIILDGIEKEANYYTIDYIESKKVTEQKQQVAIQAIEELKAKISVMKADKNYSVEERIKEVEKLYLQTVEIAKDVDYNKKDFVELVYEFAYFYNRINKLDKAEKCYEEILTILQKCDTYNYRNLDIADVYVQLGDVRSKLHREKDIVAMDFSTGLHIVKKLAQENEKFYPCLANSLCVIAQYYCSIKNYSEAESYCSNAVEIYRQLLSKDTFRYEIDLAKSLALLAMIRTDLIDSSNFESIDNCFQEALDIFERTKSNINITNTLINRGNFYSYGKLYKKAENDYKNALDIIDTLNNEIDIYTMWGSRAKVLYNLGLVHKKMDMALYRENIEQEYKDALSLYIDLESINYGTFISKIKMVVDELGFFYQTFADKENLESLEKVVFSRLTYMDSKDDVKYQKTMSDINSILLRYKNAIS